MTLDRTRHPAIHRNTSFKLIEPRLFHLDNGIPVYVLNMGDCDANRLDIIMEGGRCDESRPMIGDMVSALLREGTIMKSAQEIAETLDFYGSWMGCNTTSHNITLSIYSINRHFEKVIPVITEILQSPSFPDAELATLKGMAKNRLHTNQEKVSYLAGSEFQLHYYGSHHNLGKKITDEAIDSVSREDIAMFHEHWFRPSNTKIIFSGKIDDTLLHTLNNTLGCSWNSSQPHVNSASDAPLIEFKPQTIVVDKPNAMQCAVQAGIPTILRSHPDYIPLRMLITAFGGYFGSRLMQNIREEKGYTYGISSSLIGMRNNSCIMVSSQCDNKYAKALIKEIAVEIDKLRQHPIEKEELNRLRSYVLSDLAKVSETPFTLADYYTAAITNQMPQNYFEVQKQTAIEITSAKLQDMAIKYLNGDNMLTSVAGSKATIMNSGEEI